MKGSVKERWGKLTDDDLTVIAGRRTSSGKIEERYGYANSGAQGNRGLVPLHRAPSSGRVETIRTDLQSLASNVRRIANKQMVSRAS